MLLLQIKGLFTCCEGRGIKLSEDLGLKTFSNVVIDQEKLPSDIGEMYNLFLIAIEQAQKYFLFEQRRVLDVRNNQGIVMKCGVELSKKNPEFVNVWPECDGQMREGIPLKRGTLCVLLTTLLYNC